MASDPVDDIPEPQMIVLVPSRVDEPCDGTCIVRKANARERLVEPRIEFGRLLPLSQGIVHVLERVRLRPPGNEGIREGRELVERLRVDQRLAVEVAEADMYADSG